MVDIYTRLRKFSLGLNAMVYGKRCDKELLFHTLPQLCFFFNRCFFVAHTPLARQGTLRCLRRLDWRSVCAVG